MFDPMSLFESSFSIFLNEKLKSFSSFGVFFVIAYTNIDMARVMT
jgi:hypothetical protein